MSMAHVSFFPRPRSGAGILSAACIIWPLGLASMFLFRKSLDELHTHIPSGGYDL